MHVCVSECEPLTGLVETPMITQLGLIPLALGVITLELNDSLFIIAFHIFYFYLSLNSWLHLPIVFFLSSAWDGEMERQMEVERMDRRHCQWM